MSCGVYDFFDWSGGTANSWTGNKGQTDNANGQLIAK
jgi:hypothetical protein